MNLLTISLGHYRLYESSLLPCIPGVNIKHQPDIKTSIFTAGLLFCHNTFCSEWSACSKGNAKKNKKMKYLCQKINSSLFDIMAQLINPLLQNYNSKQWEMWHGVKWAMKPWIDFFYPLLNTPTRSHLKLHVFMMEWRCVDMKRAVVGAAQMIMNLTCKRSKQSTSDSGVNIQ